MLKIISIVAALVIAAAPLCANATMATGKVSRLYVSGGWVNFKLHGDCKTNGYWQISLANEQGRATYAMLLSAASTGAPVVISFPDPACVNSNQAIFYVYQDFPQ